MLVVDDDDDSNELFLFLLPFSFYFSTFLAFEALCLLIYAYAMHLYLHTSCLLGAIQMILMTTKAITRLLSNLRPTTCECVHLVTRDHFRSRYKDGGHTIRSVIVENSMLDANFMALCFIEPELLSVGVLHGWNRDFLTFFAPVTLTMTR